MDNSTSVIKKQWVSPHNPWLITLAVMMATFIFVLDSTIANVALPHMAGTFAASNDEAMWILTSYLIASGIVLPSVDWFSKIFGRKTFFIACILIFTFASVLCGLAKSLDMMVFARILQGLGGGALIPISQAIMLESFPKEKRGMAMSIFGLGVVVAPIIGPLLGGWITDNYNWSWIFFLNLPFGLAAAFLSNTFIEDPPYAKKQGMQKIDYVGFFFLISWLVCLQIVLDKGQNADWFNAPWICWLAGISLISMVCFIFSQTHNRESIIDLGIFKDRNYALGTAVLFFISIIMYASIAIMPLFLQNLLGYSAFLSGYATMPRGVGSIISVLLCAIFSDRVDARFLVMGALLLLSVAGFMFGFLNLDISMSNIIIPNLIYGLALGLVFVPITTLSMSSLKDSQLTNATGVQNLLKNIGGAIGTSLVVTMLSRFSQAHQHSMVGFLSATNPVFVQKVMATKIMLAKFMVPTLAEQKANYLMYVQLLKQSGLWAYIDAFRVFGFFALMIIPLVWIMKKPKRSNKNQNIGLSH